MKKIFIYALTTLLVNSILLLANNIPILLNLTILTTGIIALVLTILKQPDKLAWLPMYTLAAEMQLFFLLTNGTYLLFYYILLVANLIYLFIAKKHPAPLAAIGLYGKLTFLTIQLINIALALAGTAGPFLALAYSMTIITSAYTIMWLYTQIDQPDMTQTKFILHTLMLLVPVIDLYASYKCAKESNYTPWKKED